MKLYYDKYTYKINIPITQIYFFRNTRQEADFDARANRHKSADVDTDVNYDLVLAFVQFREEVTRLQKDFKIIVNYYSIDVYANDLAIFQELLDKITANGIDLDTLFIKYRYAVQNKKYDSGVIYHVQPKHNFRIFFKTVKLSPALKLELADFFQQYKLKPSASLNGHLTYNKDVQTIIWLWSHYHFDFNDEQLISLILLRFDNLVRKVCRIEKR